MQHSRDIIRCLLVLPHGTNLPAKLDNHLQSSFREKRDDGINNIILYYIYILSNDP